MRRKTKGFTLLEVLFALFLVSLCVVVYYPQLKNVITMQDKSYTENVVLRDLDNSVEYLKAHDDVDDSIVDENSKVVVTKPVQKEEKKDDKDKKDKKEVLENHEKTAAIWRPPPGSASPSSPPQASGSTSCGSLSASASLPG